MRRLGAGAPRSGVDARTAPLLGVTLLEMLVALSLFLVAVSLLLGIFVSSLRVQRASEDQSLRIQETESVVHLINYEVGLAGYTGTQAPQAFTGEEGPTISVTLGGSNASDRIRIRFFEDPDFLAQGDTGERLVEYRVDATNAALLREDLTNAVVETLVGSVDTMRIVAFIGRAREVVTADQVAEFGTTVLPEEIAGVRVSVTFQDGTDWTFLVGLYNRQRVAVSGGVG
jgi:hypothetical protein